MSTFHTIISGDLIASSTLNPQEKDAVERALQDWQKDTKDHLGLYSRIVRGDFIESHTIHPKDALRIALLLKSKIKSVEFPSQPLRKETSIFRQHGARVAIGIGELDRFNLERDIIDGAIIHKIGRHLDDQKTHDIQKVTIKETLSYFSPWEELNFNIIPHLAWLHHSLSNCTSKQCQVLYLKLLGMDEKAIQEKLKRAQSTINKHTSQAAWNAVEKTLNWYETTISLLNLPTK